MAGHNVNRVGVPSPLVECCPESDYLEEVMKDSEKVLGVIFLLWGAMDLLRRDWLGFALHIMAGFFLLFAGRLKLPRSVEVAAAVILFALVVVRLATHFLR